MAEPEYAPFQPPEGWDPTEALLRGLVASANSELYDEDELEMASCVLTCQALMSRGIDEETAMLVVQQASENGRIHIKYSEEDGLEVTIERGAEAE